MATVTSPKKRKPSKDRRSPALRAAHREIAAVTRRCGDMAGEKALLDREYTKLQAAKLAVEGKLTDAEYQIALLKAAGLSASADIERLNNEIEDKKRERGEAVWSQRTAERSAESLQQRLEKAQAVVAQQAQVLAHAYDQVKSMEELLGLAPTGLDERYSMDAVEVTAFKEKSRAFSRGMARVLFVLAQRQDQRFPFGPMIPAYVAGAQDAAVAYDPRAPRHL